MVRSARIVRDCTEELVMRNNIKKFLISVGMSTLVVLWFGAVLAYHRITSLRDIVAGAILVVTVFIVISLILGLVFWGAAYAFLGKQTRESLRYCFAGMGVLGALVFSISSTYDLYTLGAFRDLSSFVWIIYFFPYYLVWTSGSIWLQKQKTP